MVYEEGKTLLHLLLGPHGPNWHSIINSFDGRLLAGLLLDHGADVNARDNAHKTPLLLAMQHGTSYIVRCLLEHGADPNLVYGAGKTLLHLLSGSLGSSWRSLTGSPDDFLVGELSLEHSVDVNTRDHVHKTPLPLVVQRDAPSITSSLLQHGADPNMEDSEGNNPLHTLLLARNNDNDNDVLILQLLLKLGADTSARNKNHGTPLDLAPYYGNVFIARVLLNHANVLEDRDVGVNAQDNDHGALLRLACYCGRLEIVQDLLNRGVSASSENFQGENPLHLLSQGEYDSQDDGVRIVQELLVRGAHVNARSGCHRTPLHLASYFGRPAIARMLSTTVRTPT